MGTFSTLANISSLMTWTNAACVLATLTAVFGMINKEFILIVIRTLPRDLRGIVRFLKALRHIKRAKRENNTVLKIFEENSKLFPNRVCFYYEDRQMTFKEASDLSNQIGNYFQSQGYKKGDTVALFMENQPEFVCIAGGLNKVGVITALMNTNLRLGQLKHCLDAVKAIAVIYGAELAEAIKELQDMGGLDERKLYCSGAENDKDKVCKGAVNMDLAIKGITTATPPELALTNFSDKAFYLFTSGSTGLPKAAVIKNSRFLTYTYLTHYAWNLTCDDVIYTPLPLYHSAGVGVGTGQTLVFGCSQVIRRKFSATNFWLDCIRYKVTVGQYIGEICRYLLRQPSSPNDTTHKVRLMIGNGLRPEIWGEFVQRFQIQNVGEIYGSTEGNCGLLNFDNKIGAVGFVPRLFQSLYPTRLIRVDEETGEPIRDPKTGLVLECKPGEAGEVVGKIDESLPTREFSGYAGTDSKHKIITDVFRKGDKAFRSGDILIMDELGYFYFKDRSVDNYRWKCENVSSVEVENTISNICGLQDVAVYGVKIPGCDGQAGMAAIVDPKRILNFEELIAGMSKFMPFYARPLFIRIVDQLEMTATHKIRKFNLQKQGFDINTVKDPLYFLLNGSYVPLDAGLFQKIINEELKL
ncbi:unnamed protein product [Allacma fusca]|uniref:Very long-chain fatty acid transport protein n=1 Tax=Allacma fusca TaxID=39272 RepID=A0A8J2JIA0_9HEXA|nr:unnamed protein product [Allacma fusca]